MEKRKPNIIFLSKHFDKNVQLVAGVCPKCYAEDSEVKVTAVNRRFLKMTNQHDLLQNLLNPAMQKNKDIIEKDSIKNEKNESFSQNNIHYAESVDLTKSNEYNKYNNNNRTKENLTIDVSENLKNEGKEITNQENNNKNRKSTYFSKSYEMKKLIPFKIRSFQKNIENNKDDNEEIGVDGGQSKTNFCSSKYFRNHEKTTENCPSPPKQKETYTPFDSSPKRFENVVPCQNETKCLTPTEIMDPLNCSICQKLTQSSDNNVQNVHFNFKNFRRQSWSPPKSPHNLIEEALSHDPWALLVATIFLNKTSCALARPCFEEFLKDNPTPEVILTKKSSDLIKYFVNLGLHQRRAEQVWKMSHDFLHKKWKSVGELYGIGRYGVEAYRMFCLGDMGFKPQDRFLRIYWAWYKMNFSRRNCSFERRWERKSSSSSIDDEN